VKIDITERAVKALKPPSTGNQIHYDRQVRGFGARITANGTVSFILNYVAGGRERRYTIGTFPENSATWARAEALRLRSRIYGAEKFDPVEDRDQTNAEEKVSDLSRRYLDDYARPHKRASSIRNDVQMIQNHILPALGRLRISQVGRRDIEKLHSALKPTPYRANRVLSLLSKMFSLAIEWGFRESNPAKGVPRFQDDKREIWLKVEQLEKLKRALDKYPDQNVADAMRLLILTGARAGEVLSATWDQFDLERAVWTKPSHHTKQKKIEHVPLSAAAIDVLFRMIPDSEISVISEKRYLFPGRWTGARVTLRRPWIQVLKAAGLTTAEKIQGKRRILIRHRPAVRVHDLRHTFASHLVSSGQSLHIVGKLLGHTQPQTTSRYAHLQDSALRDAANKFGQDFNRQKKVSS
jgi:integrase